MYFWFLQFGVFGFLGWCWFDAVRGGLIKSVGGVVSWVAILACFVALLFCLGLFWLGLVCLTWCLWWFLVLSCLVVGLFTVGFGYFFGFCSLYLYAGC